jgi:hypothetical protein
MTYLNTNTDFCNYNKRIYFVTVRTKYHSILLSIHCIESRTRMRVKKDPFKREVLGVWPKVRSGHVMTSFFIPLLFWTEEAGFCDRFF